MSTDPQKNGPLFPDQQTTHMERQLFILMAEMFMKGLKFYIVKINIGLNDSSALMCPSLMSISPRQL